MAPAGWNHGWFGCYAFRGRPGFSFGDASDAAFVGEEFLMRSRGLDAVDGPEALCLLDEFGSESPCVFDVFLGSVWMADVKAVLADIHSYAHSGLIHGMLSHTS